MGEIKPLEVPKWGMTMEEGTVGDWLVAVGESFTAGQPIVTVESSKISNDLEAPFASTLRRIVAGAGETLPVGALIGVAADDSSATPRLTPTLPPARPPPRRPRPPTRARPPSSRGPRRPRHPLPPWSRTHRWPPPDPSHPGR